MHMCVYVVCAHTHTHTHVHAYIELKLSVWLKPYQPPPGEKQFASYPGPKN